MDMIMNRAVIGIFAGVLILGSSLCAYDLKVRADREDGIYDAGEDATWTIEVVNLEPGEVAPDEIDFELLSNGEVMRDQGTLDYDGDEAVYSAARGDAGTLLFIARSGDVKGYAGAAFDIDEIQPAQSRPDDFYAFWDKQISRVKGIDLNPQLKRVETEHDHVEYWDVTLDNINDTHVRGQLARPKEAKGKLPALIIFQWAGVYGLNKGWVYHQASDGFLVLNILAHDLPIYESEAYYKEKAAGELEGYAYIGNDDRETSYFLRMYLGCYQAVRYMRSRPDWDGRIMVLQGGSQGGMQALVTAAMCNDVVTAVAAGVPAGCDLNGPAYGRGAGWPNWYGATDGKDPAAVRKAAEYFDVVNFAPDILCPTFISLGLGDTTCPPSGILTVANEVEGPVELMIVPHITHGHSELNSHDGIREAANQWIDPFRTE